MTSEALDADRGTPAGRSLRQTALFVVGLAFVAPVLWMLVTSLKPSSQIFSWPPVLIPRPPQWHNYPDALLGGGFLRYLANTAVLSVLSAAGAVFSSTLVAYGLSRLEWKGRDIAFLLVLSTLLLPDFVTLIPLFALYRKLGLVGGYAGFAPLALPFWLGKAYFVFLLRQFMMTIPRELSDAARIDGCSELGILWRIILPLCRPALLSILLFSLIQTWSDFLGPLVYLRDERFYTVSIGLAQFQTRYATQWDQMMAAATISIAPVLIVFVITQKYFIRGITMSGIK